MAVKIKKYLYDIIDMSFAKLNNNKSVSENFMISS